MSLSSKRRDVSETPVTAGLQDEEINTLSEKSIAAKAGAYCKSSSTIWPQLWLALITVHYTLHLGIDSLIQAQVHTLYSESDVLS